MQMKLYSDQIENMKFICLCLAVTFCFGNKASSEGLNGVENVVQVEEFEISGEDLIYDFIQKNRTLVVRGGCRKWPIYAAMSDSEAFDEKLQDLPLQTSLVFHENYGIENSTLGYFIRKDIYGRRFVLEKLTESVESLINIPWMITSCEPMFRAFSETKKASMIGSKTKLYTFEIKECTKKSTLHAILSGTGKLQFYGKRNFVQLSASDLVFIPQGSYA